MSRLETSDRHTALVTGASSGIGAVFAHKLAARGYDLILVARRRDRLERLAMDLETAHPIAADVLVADLSRITDVLRVEERIAAAANLELLVNNAGFGSKGCFTDSDVDEQDQMHRVHVVATMLLTHAALAGMTLRGRGSIINVSSIGAFYSTPGSVSYCATKAWMNMFTTGLHMELTSAGSPVRVQALCPGLTHTKFHETMGMNTDKFPALMWMPAEDVVEASLAGLARGKVVVIPGWGNRLMVFLIELIPSFLLHRISIAAGRKMGRLET